MPGMTSARSILALAHVGCSGLLHLCWQPRGSVGVAAAAAAGTAECTELPACKGFADQLPAQTQFGYLTCDSQYSQVDKSAPPGVTVKMVCPVSCDFCPEDLSHLSDNERCLKSPHCFPQFDVCMDGYGGFPDCRHMPQATSYDGKTSSHGQPHGYGKLKCALNEQGYHASGLNTEELRAQMARHHACEYIGEFSAGERQGDGVFRHSIQATSDGGKFSYECVLSLSRARARARVCVAANACTTGLIERALSGVLRRSAKL